MKVIGKRMNPDGGEPLVIELEAPDLSPEEVAARKEAREARMAARRATSPDD